MNRPILPMMLGITVLFLAQSGAPGQAPRAEPLPTPKYTISLGGRSACVTPCTHHLARADGGIIDVQTPSPNTLTVSMTGTPAAENYMCCTSAAKQEFHLEQEFEITCSDPGTKSVTLVLDSTLTGYVRSLRDAGASARLASASVAPLSGIAPPLVLGHPPFCVSGTEGRLCNQHLPPVENPSMPLGRYVLTADFVLDTTASGICNARAAADFSPDTALPPEFVRTRDPFQGVSKKLFGFILTLSANPPSESPSTASAMSPATVIRTASKPLASPSRRAGSSVPTSAKVATSAKPGTVR